MGVGDYTEEDDLDYERVDEGNFEDLERRENESMGIDNIEARDYKDQEDEKEESTRTGHAFVKQSLEATYRPHHDPEFWTEIMKTTLRLVITQKRMAWIMKVWTKGILRILKEETTKTWELTTLKLGITKRKTRKKRSQPVLSKPS